MSRGGARVGAGRPKGTKNVTRKEVDAMVREVKRAGGEIKGTSLEIMQGIYSGKIKEADISPFRFEADKAALTYEHARLTDATLRQVNPYDAMSKEEQDAFLLKSVKDLMDSQEWRGALIELAKQHLGMIENPTPSGNVIPITAAIKESNNQTTH